MFFQPEALKAIRRMILADDPKSRQLALNDILPIQRSMFRELFEVMEGLPVTIRLLDPPLHEFLPSREEDISEVADQLGVNAAALSSRLEALREANPMLGHRGVRIGITTPEVYRTQVRAIFEAACELSREGKRVIPEVMIPLVGIPAELERMRNAVVEVAEEVIAEYGAGPKYKIGTMIELPRAALLAAEVAKHADFFSFGTNDLTQMTYGLSRDDMGKFFPAYQREGLMPTSPLAVFDIEGVGQLVEMAAERGRSTNKTLKLRADGGTLFLDEVAELPPAAQVRLLRVLQDGSFQRVGGQESHTVDVRIVAATHRDVTAMVRDGRFRQDLWYRVSVFPILLPALRERRGDIPALARHFAERAGLRLFGRALEVCPEDLTRLSAYDWPGNVRELAAVIERAAILGNGHTLEIAPALGLVPSVHARTGDSTDGREAIEAALRTAHGRIEGPFGAAAALGVNPHTLRSRMRRLGIEWGRFRGTE